jgi:hypothetical protein
MLILLILHHYKKPYIPVVAVSARLLVSQPAKLPAQLAIKSARNKLQGNLMPLAVIG